MSLTITYLYHIRNSTASKLCHDKANTLAFSYVQRSKRTTDQQKGPDRRSHPPSREPNSVSIRSPPYTSAAPLHAGPHARTYSQARAVLAIVQHRRQSHRPPFLDARTRCHGTSVRKLTDVPCEFLCTPSAARCSCARPAPCLSSTPSRLCRESSRVPSSSPARPPTHRIAFQARCCHPRPRLVASAVSQLGSSEVSLSPVPCKDKPEAAHASVRVCTPKPQRELNRVRSYPPRPYRSPGSHRRSPPPRTPP